MKNPEIILLFLITPLFGCTTASTTGQKKAGDFPTASVKPSPTPNNSYPPNQNYQPNPSPSNGGFKYPPVPNNYGPSNSVPPSNGYNPMPPIQDPQNPPSNSAPQPKQQGANAAESTDFEMTNSYRSQVGAAPLQLDVQISEVARRWSVTQHDRRDIGHDGFESRASQLNLGNAGENVAMNGGMGSSTDSAMGKILSEQWRNSPGHYQNMIGSQFRRIGIGIYCGQNGCYGTQIFGD